MVFSIDKTNTYLMKERMKVFLLKSTMNAIALVPSSFSSSCLWLFLVASLCSICFSDQNLHHVQCIPSERLALVDLKSNLTDPANRLSSWVGKDCCSWSSVVCDNITGHVHEIHLRGPEDGIHGHCHGFIVIDLALNQMLGGTISPSVIKLLQLRYLDLSCNDFGSNMIPAFIGSFQNLIYLNFSQSNFSGEIPHQLGHLSALQALDLHHVGSFLYSKSLKWLKNLKGLRYLDMGGIELAEASDWFPVISNLTSLLELHLSYCGLYGLPSNPTSVNFTSLIVLDLSGNPFNNMLLPRWIFSMHNLASLDLTNCYLSGVDPGTHNGFHSMPSLRTLCLSSNTFVNSTSFLNGLSSLSNLRFLDVSFCGISSPILGNLQKLSFVVHLDLWGNQIVEEIPKSLSNLCNLTTLDLGDNKFFGNVSELLETFCECESPKLEILALGNNYQLIGQLPERLGKLKNLVRIDFSNNQLTGAIPDSLGRLSLLQILDINTNQLSGSIPDTIGGLSSLDSLDLSYNMLNGSLPKSIGRLSKLSSLSLDHNSLTGIVTEKHFANLTALNYLLVGYNKLVFKLNLTNWIPSFKLSQLTASSCSLGPKFPSWIQSQTNLTVLDVSNANISDTIPSWIWTTFSNVDYLNISHNNIQGTLGDVSFLAPASVLDLSNNHLHGPLPGNFNRADLQHLDLSNNNLSGSLQHFLCSGIQEPRQLIVLNLANNSMSGVIPDCWMNWQSLYILNLEKNQFTGIIPSSLRNISSLLSLNMDGNRLTGNLPPWLLNSNSLVVIELAGNELMGEIPPSIGRDITSLRVLSLRSNKFEGKIPNDICQLSSLQVLDLAHNDLSGSLPKCFTNFSVISGSETSSPILLFDITTNPEVSLVTKGNTYTYSTILYLVTSLDFSNNKFSGSIPEEIFRLLGLRFLNLSHNDLSGTIPNSFSKNGTLESLDLSMNHLHGNIPLSLSQLTTLNWLNVSYNNLVGKIPTGPQLQTLNESSFAGNALCGAPLLACLQSSDRTIEMNDRHDEPDGIDWILVILTLVGLLVGFWIIVAPLFLSKQWRNAYYQFLNKFWFKLQNLILLLFLSTSTKTNGINIIQLAWDRKRKISSNLDVYVTFPEFGINPGQEVKVQY